MIDVKTIKKSLENGATEFNASVVKFLLDEIEKYKQANLIELQGWKGTSGVEIQDTPKTYIVREFRKNKNSGEVEEQTTYVEKENVEYTRELLKRFKGKTKYREVVTQIIKDKNLTCTIDEFNGGHWRAKAYFVYYYYPIRILEYLGEIEYGGQGTIKILK